MCSKILVFEIGLYLILNWGSYVCHLGITISVLLSRMNELYFSQEIFTLFDIPSQNRDFFFPQTGTRSLGKGQAIVTVMK